MIPNTRIDGRADGPSVGAPTEVVEDGVKGDEAGGVLGTAKSECRRRGMFGWTWRKKSEICRTTSAPGHLGRQMMILAHKLGDHFWWGYVGRLVMF